MKTVAAIITLLGLASCSAHTAGPATSVMQLKLRAAATAPTEPDVSSIVKDALSAAAGEVEKNVPELTPLANAVEDVTASCTADEKKAGQEFAVGLIEGFQTAYPDLSPCMTDNKCLATKLGRIFERIADSSSPRASDMAELEVILYTDFFDELSKCQKSPKQALQLQQISSIVKKTMVDNYYMVKHEVVNFILHGDEMMDAMRKASIAFEMTHDYTTAGKLLAEAYIALIIGSPEDALFPGAKKDLLNANVVALENAVVETAPLMTQHFANELVQTLHKEWPYINFNSKCSHDIDAVKDDLVGFVKEIADDVKDPSGDINPNWEKIEKAWNDLKGLLEAHVEAIMTDCTIGENVTTGFKEIAKKAVASSSVESMKPIILRHASKVNCPHGHHHHHHGGHHHHHHGGHHHHHHGGHHRHHHPHADKAEAVPVRRLQEPMLEQALAEDTIVAGELASAIIASGQSQLLMKQFGKYAKAAEKKSDAHIETQFDMKCKEEFGHLEEAFEASVAAYVLHNQTATRALEMAAAALEMYAVPVIEACVINDPPLAARITKEGIAAAEEVKAEFLSMEGHTPTEGTTTKAPCKGLKKSIYNLWGLRSSTSTNTDGKSYGPTGTDIAIFASLCVGVLSLVALAIYFTVRGCRKRSSVSSSPLLEGQMSEEPRRSWLMTAPCHPGSDTTLATEESAARDTPLPEELPAGV